MGILSPACEQMFVMFQKYSIRMDTGTTADLVLQEICPSEYNVPG